MLIAQSFLKRFLTIVLLALPLAAQTPKADELAKTITALDTALFDAYNTCDMAKFGALLSEDLEFYHDQGGLSTGRQSTIDAMKRNICGKTRRDLAPGTLRVFPLNGYGAIETGIHFFCEAKNAKCPVGSGTAKFTHVWQLKDGAWKITRILSYDHCSNCSTMTPPEFRTAPK